MVLKVVERAYMRASAMAMLSRPRRRSFVSSAYSSCVGSCTGLSAVIPAPLLPASEAVLIVVLGASVGFSVALEAVVAFSGAANRPFCLGRRVLLPIFLKIDIVTCL